MNGRSVRAAILAAVLAGCGRETPAPTEGTLALSFVISSDFLPQMDEEAVGTFYGVVHLADHVGPLGPEDDAEPLEYLELSVDLRPDGGPTDVLHTTGPLPADWVAVLGFLDSDANADPEDADPDTHDPSTFPADNTYEVVAGADTPVAVRFGLLYP